MTDLAPSLDKGSRRPSRQRATHQTSTFSADAVQRVSVGAGGNKAMAPSTAARLMDLVTLDFKPELDFVATNRVVAVIEKAIERLQLLSLLDMTAPDDSEEAATRAAATQRSVERDAITANMIGTKRSGATRVAATFRGPEGAAIRHTSPAVTAALMTTMNLQRRGRKTVAELLEEQQTLEARYGELLRATQVMQTRPGEPVLDVDCYAHIRDPQLVKLQQELKSVSARLREHNKYLCTQLKDNPNDADNWRKISNERVELIALLQGVVRELTEGYEESQRSGGDSHVGSAVEKRAMGISSTAAPPHSSGYMSITSFPSNEPSQGNVSLSKHAAASRFGAAQVRRTNQATTSQPRIPLSSSFTRFANKILQEQAAQRWADELVEKERQLNQNVKQLQSDLLMERNRKEKEVAQRQARIVQLGLQLRERKRQLKERSDEAKAQVEAATEGLQRQAGNEDRLVTERMRRHQQLLETELRTNELFSKHLQERTAAMDILAVEWDKKNQTEIKVAEMKKIDAEQTRQQCSEHLETCERDLCTEKELKEIRDAANQKEQETAAANEARRTTEYDAASILQYSIKSMFTRQALVKLKKTAKKRMKAAAEKAAREAAAAASGKRK